MSNVITLPQKSVAPKALPRQRVFMLDSGMSDPCSVRMFSTVSEEEKAGIWEEMWAMITTLNMMRVIAGRIQLNLWSVKRSSAGNAQHV